MLQSIRESLKGPVAYIVIAVIVGSMVLFGVESLFINSAVGTNVGKVNGEDVSEVELYRAMTIQKINMQQQFQLSPDDERLQDENLREPTLQSVMQRKAILQVARQGGMAADSATVKQDLIEAFTRDGELDRESMNDYMRRFAYTPATFTQAESDNYILRQLVNGLSSSSFITQKDLELYASMAGQKRSFYSLTLPKADVEKEIQVTDDDVKLHFEENPDRYMEEEKVSVEYIEISTDRYLSSQTVPEDDILTEYERQTAEFESSTEYEIAHILIEDKESEAEKTRIISELKTKLADGDDFAQLAKEYSDDLGSKNVGGSLGTMNEDVLPEELVDAVKLLSENEVSGPVNTDAGTHFVKLVSKKEVLPPTFEERKEAIAAVLKESAAAEEFLKNKDLLDELTFGAENLEDAARTLGVEIQTSELFSRAGGTGITANEAVYTAAFGKEVKEDKVISPVLDLPNDKAVVIRLKEHQPERIKAFDTVKEGIKTQLRNQQINDMLTAKADLLIGFLNAGGDAEALAEGHKAKFESHEALERTSVKANRLIVNKAFTMPRPSDEVTTVFDFVELPNGDLSVVGLTKVIEGQKDSLEDAQLNAMQAQLKQQLGAEEYSAFEKSIISKAKFTN